MIHRVRDNELCKKKMWISKHAEINSRHCVACKIYAWIGNNNEDLLPDANERNIH